MIDYDFTFRRPEQLATGPNAGGQRRELAEPNRSRAAERLPAREAGVRNGLASDGALQAAVMRRLATIARRDFEVSPHAV